LIGFEVAAALESESRAKPNVMQITAQFKISRCAPGTCGK
jgi:hypothetical protein